jgi:hypothetical protein
MKTRRWCSSMAEQLICNQQVAGSIPIASSAVTKGSIENTTKRSVPINVRVRRQTRLVSEGFPSGQREQTVNLSPLASKVRILPPPPHSPTGIKSQENKTECFAGVAQLVELQPSKLDVAGSNPVSRSAGNLQQNLGRLPK